MKVSFQGIYDLYNKTVTPNEHGTLAVESSLDIFAENFEKIKISPHFAKVPWPIAIHWTILTIRWTG